MSDTGKDSLLGNKIAAGLLTAGLIFWGANRIANIVIPSDAPEKPAIKLTGLATAAAPTAAPVEQSVIPLIASADVAKGQAFVQQQCSSCHTLTPGGASGVGPDLYGVMGAAMFSGGGFGYSDAVKGKAHGDWNYTNMSDWLSNPQGFAPGTAMSYSGIKNAQTRADVEAYLRTLAATPVALPSAADVKAADASEAPAVTATPDSATTAAAAPSIDTLFATADINKGQAVVQQQCSSCHTVTKGGADGVGPNLYGIVGAESFHEAGFSYSDAVKSKSGSHWTADSLSDWLKDPNTFAPGTAMSFAGIKNDQTRADVIDWLNKDSDSPTKLP